MTRPDLPTVPDLPRVRGPDVSVFQNPRLIDWDRLAETHRFCICRSTYGTRLDRHVTRHASEVRRVAMTLGLYHFWTVTNEDDQQLRAFQSIAKRVRLGKGDLVPAVDIEDHGLRRDQPPKYRVSPEWNSRLHAFCTALVANYGRCLVYCSQNDWVRLGRPDWHLELPLWVPHWTSAPAPRTPGNRQATIWQHRVAPLPGIYPKPIDQNIALGPLPLIGDDAWIDDRRREQIEGQIGLTAQQSYEESRKP